MEHLLLPTFLALDPRVEISFGWKEAKADEIWRRLWFLLFSAWKPKTTGTISRHCKGKRSYIPLSHQCRRSAEDPQETACGSRPPGSGSGKVGTRFLRRLLTDPYQDGSGSSHHHRSPESLTGVQTGLGAPSQPQRCC